MYTLIREGLPDAARGVTVARPRFPRGVARTVVLLGLTSLFTDISSEMVSAVLPLYFLFYLRFTPFEFGVIDGLYQGASAIARVGSAVVADRWNRRKPVAVAGYALSAVCKLALPAVGAAWGAVLALILVDRTGKGIRTSPRDALISLSSRPEDLGAAFGVHRALDTVGALLGPLVAFGLLLLMPFAFDVVFVVSFAAALIGLGIITLFVEEHVNGSVRRPSASLRSMLDLVREPRFAPLLLVGGLLGLATISDAFLYLTLQRRVQFGIAFLPLLYVATSVVYAALAVPVGRLADRIGRPRVFLAGYALLLPVYAVLLAPDLAMPVTAFAIVLFGTYYAATDGVLMAIASSRVDPAIRTTGIATLTTVTGLSRLVGSVVFGALWTLLSGQTAVAVFMVGLAVAIALAAITFSRAGRRGDATT